MRLYMSSADLMERNLDWRVEAAFPIYDPELKREVFAMLSLQLQDDTKARILDRKQCNEYVNDGMGRHRAQYETQAYYAKLYADSEAQRAKLARHI